MTPTEFLNTYAPYAKETEKKYGVPYLVTLSQAALESGYGKSAPGFNFFGVKAGKAWTGEKQLLRTTEILNTPSAKFPEIISVTPLSGVSDPIDVFSWSFKTAENLQGVDVSQYLSGTGTKYKYVVKDWFRKYASPLESFNDHAIFLKTNPRYKAAFNTTNPSDFAREVAKAGYATDTDYFNKLNKLITGINQVISNTVTTIKENPGKAGAGAGGLLLLLAAGYWYLNSSKKRTR